MGFQVVDSLLPTTGSSFPSLYLPRREKGKNRTLGRKIVELVNAHPGGFHTMASSSTF